MPKKRFEHEWAEIEREWKQSGKGIMAFCKERRMSYRAFQGYRKRSGGASDAAFVEVTSPAATRAAGLSGIVIKTARGLSIEIKPNFDVRTLESVLRVIKVER